MSGAQDAQDRRTAHAGALQRSASVQGRGVVNTSAGPQLVRHEGDTWRLLSRGASRPDGAVYCHLASATRGRRQANGWVPLQIGDWIPGELLAGIGAAPE